jgi:two-component system NarL family sensor kinase
MRWYVDGFSERSKIKVDLEIRSEPHRLSNEIELAIFRVVQECLTNIHRHSGSKSAKIALWEENNPLVIQIKDAGKGIPLQKQLDLSSSGGTGVGFRGMRERLRQFNGDLDIQSGASGTCVTASIPLPESNT